MTGEKTITFTKEQFDNLVSKLTQNKKEKRIDGRARSRSPLGILRLKYGFSIQEISNVSHYKGEYVNLNTASHATCARIAFSMIVLGADAAEVVRAYKEQMKDNKQEELGLKEMASKYPIKTSFFGRG